MELLEIKSHQVGRLTFLHPLFRIWSVCTFTEVPFLLSHKWPAHRGEEQPAPEWRGEVTYKASGLTPLAAPAGDRKLRSRERDLHKTDGEIGERGLLLPTNACPGEARRACLAIVFVVGEFHLSTAGVVDALWSEPGACIRHLDGPLLLAGGLVACEQGSWQLLSCGSCALFHALPRWHCGPCVLLHNGLLGCTAAIRR